MKKVRSLFLFSLMVLIHVNVFAQKPISGDCSNPIKLVLGKLKAYGPTQAPEGEGKINEIEEKRNSKYAFEKEHNSAWYLLQIKVECDLELEIVPTNLRDDYDFLLYKCDSTSGAMCELIRSKKVLPVRSNISRNKKELESKTGLSLSAKNEFVKEGIGEAYSKAIHVKPHEQYLLVLDNVYSNGEGHTLHFTYANLKRDQDESNPVSHKALPVAMKSDLQAIEVNAEGILEGTLLNENKEPVKAQVYVENRFGTEMAATVSNETNGKYVLPVKLVPGNYYTINFFSDSSFTNSIVVRASQDKIGPRDLSSVLQKLKGGKKYNFNNLCFVGNESTVLPESMSSLNALYKLMKRNPKLTIEIAGHTNGGGHIKGSWGLVLSESRSHSIYTYLIFKGIAANRLSTTFFGDEFELNPYAKEERAAAANRRVEIKVISF